MEGNQNNGTIRDYATLQHLKDAIMTYAKHYTENHYTTIQSISKGI